MKNHDTPVTNEKTTHKVNSKNHIETFREETRFPVINVNTKTQSKVEKSHRDNSQRIMIQITNVNTKPRTKRS